MFPVIHLVRPMPTIMQDDDSSFSGGLAGGSIGGGTTIETLSSWLNIEVSSSGLGNPTVTIRRNLNGLLTTHFVGIIKKTTKSNGTSIQMSPGNYTIEII